MKKHRKFEAQAQAQKEEKKSKTGLYIAILFSLIMIGGVAGIFMSNPSTSSNTYGSYSFTNTNNQWTTQINGKQISFFFMPQQVSTISIPSQALQLIKTSQDILLTFNPENSTQQQLQAFDVFRLEFSQAVNDVYPQKRVGFAVSQPSSAYNLPIITCANASYYVPVIYAQYSNDTSVKLNNDCIQISASDEYGLLGIMDSLRYRIYGVING